MATITGSGVASQSQIKVPQVNLAPPSKAPAPLPPPPAKPSTIVTVSKPKEDLGLYSASKAAPATAPASKPEALETNENGVVAGTGRVMLDIEASDSGYANKIYFSTDNFKTKQYVGIDNQTGTVDLGTFKPGTTIQFGIDNGQGDFFRTGGKSANTDQVDHTQVSKLADGGVRVGFEDLRGGGDRDFNDAIIKVRSVPVAAPVIPAAPVALSGAVQRAPAVPPPAAGQVAPVGPKDVPAKPAIVAPKPASAPVIAKDAPAKPAPAPVANKDAPPKPATPVQASNLVSSPAVKPPAPAPATAANKDLSVKPAVPVAAPAPAVKAAAATASTTAKAAATTAVGKQPAAPAIPVDKGNRSGLGDGTNPGQGSGTGNSPNQGTLNPGGLR